MAVRALGKPNAAGGAPEAVSSPEVACRGVPEGVSGLEVAYGRAAKAVSGLEVASAHVAEDLSGLQPAYGSMAEVVSRPEAGLCEHSGVDNAGLPMSDAAPVSTRRRAVIEAARSAVRCTGMLRAKANDAG